MRHRFSALPRVLLVLSTAAACVDAPSDDGVDTLDGDDAAPTVELDPAVDAELLAGERCDDAQPVTLRGAPGATTLSTVILASLADYGGDYAPHCTAQEELGDDRVYRVTLPPGQRLDAKLSPTFPAALYFLAGPAASCATTCLEGEAIAATDQAFLSHDNVTDAPEDVFVVVDSFTAIAGAGEYRLALRQSPMPDVAP